MPTDNQYAQRNPRELGKFYTRHVSAMTAEGLHAKSDIAAELGWRDLEIARLREALSFYADSDRYHGPNQRRDDATNQFGHDNCPYVWDVTRDGGAIARAALENSNG